MPFRRPAGGANGGSQIRLPPDRYPRGPVGGFSRRSVQAYSTHRWRYRLVLWDLVVESSGFFGLVPGRSWNASRPPRSAIVAHWRYRRLVEAYEPDRRVLFEAEMKTPGRAWLEFEVKTADCGSTVRQTAIFDPVGLPGLAYWYLLYPFHNLIFAGMIRGIARHCSTTHR